MVAQIDLTRFCSRDSKMFERPAIRGGFQYATDGRILVRVPTAEAGNDSSSWIVDGEKWFAESPLNPTNVVWPEQTETPKPCDECDGVGTVEERDCDECYGTGQTECWECGHEGECPECDGTGIEIEAGTCPECEGRKFIYPHRKITGLTIGEKYDAMVRELPNPRVIGHVLEGKAILGVFDGGEFILMSRLDSPLSRV